MKIMQMKKEKGFTLIELMIVVAIIGILAAIAIPQFSSYRNKAFNAAAMSDLHTARMAEEAVYADYQEYGASTATNVAAVAAGVLLTANGFISTGTAGNGSAITLSKNVNLRALTDAIPGTAASITVQHTQGDKAYAAETDQSGTYQKTVTTIGTIMTAVAAGKNVTDAYTAGYTAM